MCYDILPSNVSQCPATDLYGLDSRSYDIIKLKLQDSQTHSHWSLVLSCEFHLSLALDIIIKADSDS